MKILFLTDNFPPEVNAPATRTFEHCVEWVKAGAEVTVITCAPNFPQGKLYAGYKNRLVQHEYMERIRVIRVWTYMTANKGFFKRTIDYLSFMVSAFLAALTIKTDVIVATSPQFFTAVAGCLVSMVKRRPWVMEVRDLWPDSIIGVEAVKEPRMLSFFFRLEKMLYRHAKLIIPVTETFKKEIVRKGISPHKIHVVRNGSNLAMFSQRPPDNALKEQLNLTGRKVVSYIGTHGMAHGLEFIVRCAGATDPYNITFLFIGDGAKKQATKELAEKLKLKNVIFLDPVPKERIPAFLSITDIALIPLKKAEIFTTVIPSKIFEAAAMQVPILLGVAGEAGELIESYKAGICYEPESGEDFHDKLIRLASDKTLYNECRAGGLRLATDFDRTKLAMNFLQILSENIQPN